MLDLADAVTEFRHIYNTIRPHESLDFRTQISRYLAPPEPHLSEPESVQDS